MCIDSYDCFLYKDGELIKKYYSVADAAKIIAIREGLRKDRIYREVLHCYHTCTPFMGYMIDIFPPAGSYGNFSKTLRKKQNIALMNANKACSDARNAALRQIYTTSDER